MKKFLFSLLLVFCFITSCGPGKHVATNVDQTYGYTQMYYTMNKTLTISQVDSMIVTDKLADLDSWLKNVNGDKSKVLIQYYYIKSLDENNELIYILTKTQIDTVFRCSKRVTKEIE